MSNAVVQPNGPIQMTNPESITHYQPPVSRDQQRSDRYLLNLTMPKIPVNPVPQLEDPFIDHIPKDYIVHTDNTIQNNTVINEPERASIFLENGGSKNHWYNNSVKKQPNVSPLANHPVAQVFVGCVSILGLFVVFRALKL